MKNIKQKPQSQKPQPKKQLKNAAILSGIGIQMGVTIYLFVKLGKWLDINYNNGDKLYIIIFTLAGVAISIYTLIKLLKRVDY